MNKLLKILVIIFVLFAFGSKHIASAEASSLKIEQLESAFNIIDKAYPKSRYFKSTGSLISGVFRCATARKMLKGDDVMNYEKTAAYSLLGFSILRYLDGVKGLFFKSPVEKLLLEFRELKGTELKLKNGEQILKKIARYGKRDRLYHSFLRGASSIIYFYLYFKDKDKYNKYLYSGLIYTGFAAFNMFSKSKPEKAWKSYKKKILIKTEGAAVSKTQFYVLPAYKGFSTGILLAF